MRTSIYPDGIPLRFNLLILSGIIISSIIIPVAISEFSFYVPLLFAGIFLLILSYSHTLLGICCIIIAHLFLFRQTEEIDPFEVFFAVYLFIVLLGWFLRRIVQDRKPIFYTNADRALAVFLGMCFFSLIPAVANGNDLLLWFRELIPFLGYFLFFPIASEIRTRSHIKLVMGSFVILGVMIVGKNLWNYSIALSGITQFWEFIAYRQTANEPVMLAILIFSAIFFIMGGSKISKIFCGILFCIFTSALAITFSRGYWVAFIIGLILLFFFVPVRKKIGLLIGVILLTGVIVYTIYNLFGNISLFIGTSIFERFSSLSALQEDKSIISRWREIEILIKTLIYNPIIGYGFGAKYSFLNPINYVSEHTEYTHNGFLYIWFKLGLVGMISFLYFYLSSIIMGFRLRKSTKMRFYNSLILGGIILLCVMLPLSLTSPQFLQKDSILIIVLCTGIIHTLNRHKQISGCLPELKC